MAKKYFGLEKKVAVILPDPSKAYAVKPDKKFGDEEIRDIEELKKALGKISGYNFIYLEDHDTLYDNLINLNRKKLDYVLNLCDEGFENNPKKERDIPLFLDKYRIFYTGAGARCLSWCYDKYFVKQTTKKLGIPVPEGCLLNENEEINKINLEFPLIVKPNFGDGSFGITVNSIANNKNELKKAVEELRENFLYGDEILVEEFLNGNELTIGIIGNKNDYNFLLIAQEDYSKLPKNLPCICGREAKWEPDSLYWNLKSIPAKISEKQKNIIQINSLKLFDFLECRDYARFDWRLNSRGKPKLLEVNPNPGWTWDGHMAKMAFLSSMPYSKMLKKILNAAEKRFIKQSE